MLCVNMFEGEAMSGDLTIDLTEFREELAALPPHDEPADRHLALLGWLTRFAHACGCESPILVGCGAVEIYTNACTSTGDVDIITTDIARLSSNLLKIGFQRSTDQRYLYHPGFSMLFEFPAASLRPGEETVTINHDGVNCLVISPADLIVDRLETFEASGGGTDLLNAYLIYHSYYENLDHERLRDRVIRRDVRESFRFMRDLHRQSVNESLGAREQAQRIVEECRRRRGPQ